MGGNSIYSLLSDPSGRQSLTLALEEAHQAHPDDEVLSYLSHGIADEVHIFPLSEAQEQKLQSIIDSSESLRSFKGSAAIFSAQAPLQETQRTITFVPRGEQDTLRDFIHNNLAAFGLGHDVPRETRGALVRDFRRYTGINFGSIKYWGEKEGEGFREPKDLDQTLKVYGWLDRQASLHGVRVDFWDFLACIYPRVSKMIARSDSAGQIIVRVPKFMDEVPFQNFNYMTFAQTVLNRKLASRLADSTVHGHARGRSKKPLWKIIDAYADSISEEAAGDEDERTQRRQLFDFLVFIRLAGLIGNIVPARDIADRPITRDATGNPITRPLERYPTRFTLRVVPESEVVEYISFGETSRFKAQRWPFRNLASGQFDLMLDIMERRIQTLENFSHALENGPAQISGLREKLDELRETHAAHKNAFLHPEKGTFTDTPKYLEEIKEFYKAFNRFFEEIIFFTHAHGSVALGELTVPFEIVPKINGVEISPMAEGRVSVFAEDIVQAAANESWTPEEIRNTFVLRVLTTWQIASGAAKKDVLEDPEKITNLVNNFDLGISETEIQNATSHLVALNQAAVENEGVSIDPTLHRVLHLKTTGSSVLHDYYVYDYASNWRDQLKSFYESSGYGEEAIYFDSEIAENYFKSVRHPHYIFNQTKLNHAIAEIYTEEAAQSDAQQRLLSFFSHINVKTDPTPRHLLSIDESAAVLKVIEWAFQDYLENFPGAKELGAQIEINNKLLSEIVDRQVAEHPEMESKRGVIRRGIRAAIEKFNEDRQQSVSQVADEFTPLPEKGIFPERFHAFMDKWGKENSAFYVLERQKLLSAFSLIKDTELSYDKLEEALLKEGADDLFLKENTMALYAWIMQLSHEMELFDQYASTEKVAEYLNANYNAPLVRPETVAKLVREYLVRRLTTPQPVDVESLIVSELGSRFDPYPSIKSEVVSFYHMLVRKYLHHIYDTLMEKYNQVIETIDNVTEELIEDKLALYMGIGFRDFEGKVLPRLGFIHPEDKNSGSQRLPLADGKMPTYVIKTQYHPSPEKVNEFFDQVRLMAEALGEEPPESIQAHMLENYEYLSAAVEMMNEERQRKITEDKQQFMLLEAPVEKFWQRVEASIKTLVVDLNPDQMNEDETNAAIAAVEKGLEIIWDLKDELNGEIRTLTRQAHELASSLGVNDDASGYLELSERNITETESKLLRQHEELEFRLEEIEEDKRIALDKQIEEELLAEERQIREQADLQAGALMGTAGEFQEKLNEFVANARKTAAVLERLREETKAFIGEKIEGASVSISAYQKAYAALLEYQEHANELRVQLNALRSEFEELSLESIHRDIRTAIEEGRASDEVRRNLMETRKKLVTTSSEVSTRLEEAENIITSLGGLLKKIKTGLEEKENLIPLPASVSMPQAPAISHRTRLEISNAVLTFNLSNFSGISSSRIGRALEDFFGIKILAEGDNSYLVSSHTASIVRTWLKSGRSSQLVLKDLFKTNITIEAGSLGIRLADRRNEQLQAGHPLLKLTERISFILSAKSFESDFIVKLTEISKLNDQALSIWSRFVAGITNEDISNATDARIFLRRFALAHIQDFIEIKQFAKCMWLEPISAPLRVTLPDQEYREINERPLEKINQYFLRIDGSADHEKNMEAVLLFSEAFKPYLSSKVLAWWTENEAQIPESIGILWRVITDSGKEQKTDINKLNLRLSFLTGLADHLEEISEEENGLASLDGKELSRFTLKFLLENIVAIRFGKFMQDDKGRLIYHPVEHNELAKIYRMRTEHPELKIIRFEGVKAGVLGNGSLVLTPEEFDRVIAVASDGGPADIEVEHFNWKTDAFEKTTVSIEEENIYIGQLPQDDVALKFAPLLFIIHNNPRLMGLGFMLADIIKHQDNYTQAYSKMLDLMGKYNNSTSPMISTHQNLDEASDDPRILALLLQFEKEMEGIYLSFRHATETSPVSRQLPQVPENAFSEASRAQSGAEQLFSTLLRRSGAQDLSARSSIENHLALKIPSWEKLPKSIRDKIVEHAMNSAAMYPSNEIIVTPQTCTALGVMQPLIMQPIVIPNPFAIMPVINPGILIR